MDYNGEVITGMNLEVYLTVPGVIDEYVMLVPTAGAKRIIDATKPFGNHPTNSRLGRLANHATLKKKQFETNIQPIDINLDKYGNTRVVIFKARRTIQPLEQLRWDYMDRQAQTMFSE